MDEKGNKFLSALNELLLNLFELIESDSVQIRTQLVRSVSILSTESISDSGDRLVFLILVQLIGWSERGALIESVLYDDIYTWFQRLRVRVCVCSRMPCLPVQVCSFTVVYFCGESCTDIELANYLNTADIDDTYDDICSLLIVHKVHKIVYAILCLLVLSRAIVEISVWKHWNVEIFNI